MRNLLLFAVTFESFLVAEKALPSTKLITRLDQAIAQTVLHNLTSLVLATSRLRADISVQVMQYVNPPSLSVVINSPNMPQLHHALRRESKRGAHVVLFCSAAGVRGRIFDLLLLSSRFLPQLTLVCFTPPDAAGKSCDSMRHLHYPSVALSDEKVEICKGRYRFPETELWSGLRQRSIVFACGEGRSFCDEEFNTVTLVALTFLNASVTLQQGDIFQIKSTNTELKYREADVTLHYGMLTEVTPYDFHISPLLIEKRVVFYAHVSQARIKTTTRSQFLSYNLLGMSYVAAAVAGSLLAIVAIGMMTERFLHEPGSGLLQVFLGTALWRGCNVSRQKFSSNTRRVLFSFWSLSCLCLVVYVQSILTSAVILPLEQSKVLTFEQLCGAVRKESLCRCGDTEALGYLRRVPVWKTLIRSLVNNKRKGTNCLFHINSEHCPQKVRENSHVGFAIAVHPGTCQGQLGEELIIGQKPLGTILTGSFVRKGYPLARHYHSLIRREMETGLFARLLSLREYPCTKKHYREEFSSRHTPFVACIGGCALSTFVCAGEILMSVVHKHRFR